MKGLLLAGGNGTRLYPSTAIASKHLLSIYDKPMIYYPLSTMMLAGIKDISLIAKEQDIPLYKRVLGDGSLFGIHIEYFVQNEPKGIGDAFIITEHFIGNDSVCLLLGDNIFYGQGLPEIVRRGANLSRGAIIYGYWVNDPNRYGVVEFDQLKNVIGLEEKPKYPKSNYAVPGMYFYDNQVVNIAKNLKPSDRGELEITDVNLAYLRKKELKVELIGRGIAWLDTGTPESLLDAINFVGAVERRQGLKIACLEEIALRMGYITVDQLLISLNTMPNGGYKQYLQKILDNELRILAITH